MSNKKISQIVCATFVAGLFTLPVQAQNTSGSSNDTSTTSATTTPATSVTLTPLAAQVQNTLSANFDNLFLLKATQGNMAEVMTGQLASRKARNPQVRQLAQRLIQEHSAANAQIAPLLARRALPTPRFPGAMHTATYEYLSRLNNRAFDAAYMAAQVEAHENSITLYQQELAQGRDPNTRALAAALLPAILEHTAQIYSIAQAVGAPGIAERRVAMTTAANGTPNFSTWTAGSMGGMTGMNHMSGTRNSASNTSGSAMSSGSTTGGTSAGASSSTSSDISSGTSGASGSGS